MSGFSTSDLAVKSEWVVWWEKMAETLKQFDCFIYGVLLAPSLKAHKII